jgi:hypothetical protein
MAVRKAGVLVTLTDSYHEPHFNFLKLPQAAGC